MKREIFRVVEKNPHKEYIIYDDGSTSGFKDDNYIVNKHAVIIDELEGKLRKEGKL